MTFLREVVRYINGKRIVILDKIHSPSGSTLEDTFEGSHCVPTPFHSVEPHHITSDRGADTSDPYLLNLGIGAMDEPTIRRMYNENRNME